MAIAMETKILGFISLILYHHCGDLRKIPSSSRKVPKCDIYISASNTAARELGGERVEANLAGGRGSEGTFRLSLISYVTFSTVGQARGLMEQLLYQLKEKDGRLTGT